MKDGAWEETDIGSPQGGVISPLLCNIYLDEFDQELKARGIRIVRYADDILVLAKSLRQAERFRDIAVKILEEKLNLVVNKEKTHITDVDKGVAFLGVVILRKYIVIHPKRIRKFKERVRQLTPRNHGENVDTQIQRLNKFLRGWINYFKIANCKSWVRDMMGWIRRRLRMKKMKEWKTWKGLHKELRRRGYEGEFEKISVTRWRNSSSPLASMALPNTWFEEKGLVDLEKFEVGILHHYYEI